MATTKKTKEKIAKGKAVAARAIGLAHTCYPDEPKLTPLQHSRSVDEIALAWTSELHFVGCSEAQTLRIWEAIIEAAPAHIRDGIVEAMRDTVRVLLDYEAVKVRTRQLEAAGVDGAEWQAWREAEAGREAA